MSLRRVTLLLVTTAALAGCGGASDRSSAIAAEIGGTASCYGTDYTITNRLDGSKARIYDCQTDKGEICATESGGLVNDVTAEAKALFATTLGTSAPTCAT